jgi:hypothetical protein
MAFPSPVIDSVGVIGRLDNGYVLTILPPREGEILRAQIFCTSPADVGVQFQNWLAKQELAR